MGLTPYTTTEIRVHLVERFADTEMDAVKTKTSVEKLREATKRAGYPSSVKPGQ